ncbi:MAG: MBL fold metallo-hydrolase [Synergistaceae bacterium]|jgi:glyoxylase-like metal-dependent hydrolase (beta-lactamase superfamily II)|nr:MBL fold metallo-hydrolase [Synergistaceae bacterium]
MNFLELKQLGDRTWYIPGRVNIGYYEENGQGYLIDSGLDDDQGRKVLKLLNEERRDTPLRAIVNTHSNADHIGANAFIQKRTNCQVWTTRIEGILTERTSLEPLLLWSAWPFKAIRGKFIEAKPSKVVFIDQPMAIGDPRFTDEYPIKDTALVAVPLPGHYLDMIGVKTPDDVFFLADALFDPTVLEKYRFCVMLDVTSAHKTLDMIERTNARWFVPCHAPATQDAGELARQNHEGLNWVTEAVYEALTNSGRPLTREEILSHIGVTHGLEMDAAHLLLNLACVAAHLTHLSELDRVEPFVEDCRLLWRKKSA